MNTLSTLPRSMVPPRDIVEAMGWYPVLLLQDVLLAMRGVSGVRISSWYRTRASNASSGGAATSQHLVGCAIDVAGIAPGVPPSDIALRAIQGRLRLAQVAIIETSPKHLHVQLFTAGELDEAVRELAR